MSDKRLFGVKLPESWERVTVGDVAVVVGGSTPKSKEPRYWDGDIPWLAVSDLAGHTGKYISRGKRSITKAGFDSCSTQMLPAGSVVYSSRAPIGYVAIAANELCTSQGFKSLVLPKGLSSDYVYWWLQAARPLIEAQASGTTFKEVSGRGMATVPFPLPPRAEQDRIVEAVEAAMAAVSEALTSIDAAEHEMELLAAASLHSIFTEAPRNEIDTENPPHETTLGELCESVQGGIQTGPFGSQLHKADYRNSGTPVVMPKDLEQGKISESSIAHVGPKVVERLSRHTLRAGDIVQSRRGDLRKRAVVTDRETGWLCGTGCFIVRLRDVELARFVAAHLDEPVTAATLEAEALGVTMPNLNGRILKSIRLHVPPVAERERILKRVEGAQESLERLREGMRSPRLQAEVLRRSILHWAFTGQLVPQDPTDEPASGLLERIKAEKAEQEEELKAAKVKARRSRNGGKANAKRTTVASADRSE